MLPRLTWWYLLVALIVGVVSALLWLRPELRHNPALFPGLYAAVVALIWWRRYLLHGFSSHHTRLTLWNLLVALIRSIDRSSSEPTTSRGSQDTYFKVVLFGVAASAILSALMLAILLFVEPPKLCPNWHLPDKASTPLLQMFMVLTVPFTAMLCFMIIRWDWVVQKAAKAKAPIAKVVPMMLFMCVLPQVPLLLLVLRCWLDFNAWFRGGV